MTKPVVMALACYGMKVKVTEDLMKYIASLLYHYLSTYNKPHVQHVLSTSKSTVAQNRNQFITCLLLLTV